MGGTIYKISDEGVKQLQNIINYVTDMGICVDSENVFTGIVIQYKEKTFDFSGSSCKHGEILKRTIIK